MALIMYNSDNWEHQSCWLIQPGKPCAVYFWRLWKCATAALLLPSTPFPLKLVSSLCLLSSGGAAVPAFGMAVFKSPPLSRAPSAEKSQAAPPATAVDLAAAAATAAAAAAVSAPSAGATDATGLGIQPSGSKRKRDGVAGIPDLDVASSSKQVRREGASAEQNVKAPGASGPAFHLLKSHK